MPPQTRNPCFFCAQKDHASRPCVTTRSECLNNPNRASTAAPPPASAFMSTFALSKSSGSTPQGLTTRAGTAKPSKRQEVVGKPCLDCLWNLEDPTECQRSRLDCENHNNFRNESPSIPNDSRGRDFIKLINDFKREEAAKRAGFPPGPKYVPGQSRHIEVAPPDVLKAAFRHLQEDNAEHAALLARQRDDQASGWGAQGQAKSTQTMQTDERGLYVPLSNPRWQAMAPPGGIFGNPVGSGPPDLTPTGPHPTLRGPMAPGLPAQALAQARGWPTDGESKDDRRRRLRKESNKKYREKKKRGRRAGAREQLEEEDVGDEQDIMEDFEEPGQQMPNPPSTYPAPQLGQGSFGYPNPSQGTQGAPVLGQGYGYYGEPRHDDSIGGAFSGDDQPTQPYPGVAHGRSGTGGSQDSLSGGTPSATRGAPSYDDSGYGYHWRSNYPNAPRDRERSRERGSKHSNNDRPSQPNSRAGSQTDQGRRAQSSSRPQSRSTSADALNSDVDRMADSGEDKRKGNSEKSSGYSYGSRK